MFCLQCFARPVLHPNIELGERGRFLNKFKNYLIIFGQDCLKIRKFKRNGVTLRNGLQIFLNTAVTTTAFIRLLILDLHQLIKVCSAWLKPCSKYAANSWTNLNFVSFLQDIKTKEFWWKKVVTKCLVVLLVLEGEIGVVLSRAAMSDKA